MPTDGLPVQNPPRYTTTQVFTTAAGKWLEQIKTDNPGMTIDSSTYEIKDGVFTPAPSVGLETGSLNGQVVYSTVVQQIYKRVSQKTDQNGQPYTQYDYVVLMEISVAKGGGGNVMCFVWSPDPSVPVTGSSPYNADTGGQSFDFTGGLWSSML